MSERWYKEAVIYCVEVDDVPGLRRRRVRRPARADQPAGLPRPRSASTCLWLNPIHPVAATATTATTSPTTTASTRGSALSATSPSSRCRRASAASGSCSTSSSTTPPTSIRGSSPRAASPDSPYRDWYVWSETEPADRRQGIVFPGEQTETWTCDDDGQGVVLPPLLRLPARPELGQPRRCARRSRRSWASGCSSAPPASASTPRRSSWSRSRPDVDPAPQDFTILDDWRQDVQWRSGDAVLLCEANVDAGRAPEVLRGRTGRPERPGAHAVRLPAQRRAVAGAGARSDAEPLVEALRTLPQLPAMAQWATFLRNHDELDLSRLTEEQRRTSSARSRRSPTCSSTTAASGAGSRRC